MGEQTKGLMNAARLMNGTCGCPGTWGSHRCDWLGGGTLPLVPVRRPIPPTAPPLAVPLGGALRPYLCLGGRDGEATWGIATGSSIVIFFLQIIACEIGTAV